MTTNADPGDDARHWGLCASCAHRLVVTNDRGSRFVQCTRARTDPSFPRYPRLPVEACRGYEPSPPQETDDALGTKRRY